MRKQFAHVRWSLMTMFAVTTTIAWLASAAVLGSRVDSVRPSGGTWVTAAAVILTIYYWRYRIIKLETVRSVRMIQFSVMLLSLLPYVYVFAGLIADWARLPVSKWMGDPLWIYTVPVVSFVIIEGRSMTRSTKYYLLSSVIELVVVFPAWTLAWIAIQGYFGWWSM